CPHQGPRARARDRGPRRLGRCRAWACGRCCMRIRCGGRDRARWRGCDRTCGRQRRCAMSTQFWCERAWVDGTVADGVLLTCDDTGTLSGVETGISSAPAGAEVVPGLTLPGGVNAHSHAFHRILRGRTHGDGGTFWTWREVMYSVAAKLDPESYETVARAVFAEMLAGGYTSVGEFHYLHHTQDGTPYGTERPRGDAADEAAGSRAHAMERALARAAASAGIRIRLLDTCYLTGAIAAELSAEQARFGAGAIAGC